MGNLTQTLAGKTALRTDIEGEPAEETVPRAPCRPCRSYSKGHHYHPHTATSCLKRAANYIHPYIRLADDLISFKFLLQYQTISTRNSSPYEVLRPFTSSQEG